METAMLPPDCHADFQLGPKRLRAGHAAGRAADHAALGLEMGVHRSGTHRFCRGWVPIRRVRRVRRGLLLIQTPQVEDEQNGRELSAIENCGQE